MMNPIDKRSISSVSYTHLIPFILLFIKQIFKWLKKTKVVRPMVEWRENKAMKRSDNIKKGEFLSLIHIWGDSEWLINYPRFIIRKKCVESMSEKKKKSKIREEKLKIKERNYVRSEEHTSELQSQR